VNDVVRRLADVNDPGAATAFDLGALACDVASLFGHESRRRRIPIRCDAEPGATQARGDAARTARVVLGLFWRGLSHPVEGATMLVRATHDGPEAALLLEHGEDTDPNLQWMIDVAATAAADMGGRFTASRAGGTARLELRLRRETVA
jgi:hypothetical protein